MDAIEKIRQEIERLMNERYNWETDGSSESITACEALTKIYNFLDTIEEKKIEPLERPYQDADSGLVLDIPEIVDKINEIIEYINGKE